MNLFVVVSFEWFMFRLFVLNLEACLSYVPSTFDVDYCCVVLLVCFVVFCFLDWFVAFLCV
jgi:hypothetical protein